MKIAYITLGKFDIHTWSGTYYHIAQALAKNNELYYIDDLKYSFWTKISSVPKFFFFKLQKKFYGWMFSKRLYKSFAKQIQERIQKDTDLLFMPGDWGLPLSYLETDIPIVLYQDATFPLLNNFYYKNLDKQSIRRALKLEKKILDKSTFLIYSSDWAAKSAVSDYGINPDKVHTIPLGANIECSRDMEDIRNILQRKKWDKCRLLFVGVDWVRKGGDLCIYIADKLNKQGIPTQLDIVGIRKIPVELPSFAIDHGFISKSTDEGRKYLDDLFEDAHFLLVPSRSEAYGLVFCEANSFGVPAIATNVGGIPTIIKDEKNGIKFPLDANVDDYVTWITDYFTDRQKYNQLALSSFQEFEERLNWDVVSSSMNTLLKRIGE